MSSIENRECRAIVICCVLLVDVFVRVFALYVKMELSSIMKLDAKAGEAEQRHALTGK